MLNTAVIDWNMLESGGIESMAKKEYVFVHEDDYTFEKLMLRLSGDSMGYDLTARLFPEYKERIRRLEYNTKIALGDVYEDD